MDGLKPVPFKARGVQSTRCSKHSVFKVRGVQSTRCSRCVVFKVRGVQGASAEGAECGRARDVGKKLGVLKGYGRPVKVRGG